MNDSIKNFAEALKREEEYKAWERNAARNPRSFAARFTRFSVFLMTTLFYGTVFLLMFMGAHWLDGYGFAIPGAWTVYFTYGLSSLIGWKSSRHHRVFGAVW